MTSIANTTTRVKYHQRIIFLLSLVVFTNVNNSSLAYAEENSALPKDSQATHITRRIQTANAQQAGVGQNIGFVEQLIHQSAAAKQILNSQNAEARALREQAIGHLEDAKREKTKGNVQAAGEALDKAKKVMFQAVRLSGKKSVNDKKASDYAKRVKSSQVLLEAHKRINQEKSLGQSAKEVEQHVEDELEKAQKAFNQGQLEKALELANAAYLSIKLNVTRLRNGDTLVRTLHFETKEDEYNYELERNKTHKVLVNVVLKDKLSPQMKLMIKIPMNKAEELREQAIQQAAENRFEEAIKTLEQSTQQIIRSIRMAGVFIPG